MATEDVVAVVVLAATEGAAGDLNTNVDKGVLVVELLLLTAAVGLLPKLKPPVAAVDVVLVVVLLDSVFLFAVEAPNVNVALGAAVEELTTTVAELFEPNENAEAVEEATEVSLVPFSLLLPAVAPNVNPLVLGLSSFVFLLAAVSVTSLLMPNVKPVLVPLGTSVVFACASLVAFLLDSICALRNSSSFAAPPNPNVNLAAAVAPKLNLEAFSLVV